jgi:3-deoxy-D-manno-octulosonic-acid transferase
LWLEGRKSVFTILKEQIPADGKQVIWMHCASLGEFEQGRPLLEKIRSEYKNSFLLLTFFSPSGFEVQKKYKGADLVTYLPMDGRKNAGKFLEIVSPSLAIFVKYESWFYYLKTLQERAIPTILIAAIFKAEQNYFGIFGGFLRQMLNYYSHIFVQDSPSLELIQNHQIRSASSVSGDTRFDRVQEIASVPFQNNIIDSFCKNSQVIVAGSSWKEDEDMLSGYLKDHPEIKAIIAPHETDTKSIARLQSVFPNSILLSEANEKLAPSVNVLVINTMGMLSRLYRWSSVSYIGGGFNKSGIHNILEAAVYGKITVFGPKYHRSGEAEALVALGGAYTYSNYTELDSVLDNLLKNPAERQKGESTALNYVRSNLGATNIILDYIRKLPDIKNH